MRNESTTLSEARAMEAAAFWLEGVFLIIAGVIGLVGNATAVYIFGRQRVQRNFHGLMVALATFDLVYILVSIFIFSLPQFFEDFNRTFIYCHLLPFILPAAQVKSIIYVCIFNAALLCLPYVAEAIHILTRS